MLWALDDVSPHQYDGYTTQLILIIIIIIIYYYYYYQYHDDQFLAQQHKATRRNILAENVYGCNGDETTFSLWTAMDS